MDISSINYRMFDLVRILNPNNISYIHSDQPGRIPANGVWQVSAVLGSDLLLVKDNVTVRIPANDVLKLYEYDITNFTHSLGKLSVYGEERKENSSNES